MSNLQPLFASAPRIKLYINNQVVAYAIGFNFNVSVDVQPVFVLGRFAPVSLEPTMYNTVTGTLQIVRLKNVNLTANANAQSGKADAAQPITTGSITDAEKLANASGGSSASGGSNTPISQSELFRHITPSQLLLSQAFDMKLYMKIPKTAAPAVLGVGTAPSIPEVLANTQLAEVEWMNIQSCRITSRNTNISMGQLVNEPLNFQGLLAAHAVQGTGLVNAFSLDGTVKQETV